MIAFVITIIAAFLCIAGVLAKHDREIKEIQDRRERPMFGPVLCEDQEDTRS